MPLNQQMLNEIMNEETFKEMMQEAKELSKKQFLLFGTQALGKNGKIWDKLWNIPIIASHEGNRLITHELSEERENEVLDIIDLEIDKQILFLN